MTKTQLKGIELLLAALALSAWLAVVLGQSGCATTPKLSTVDTVHITTDPTPRVDASGLPVYGECRQLDNGHLEVWVHAGSIAQSEGRELARRDVWRALQLARNAVTSCAPSAYLFPTEWPSMGPAPGPSSEPTTTTNTPQNPSPPTSMPPADAGAAP